MADYVTDGKIGIDLTATYASTSAGSTTLFPVTPGTRVNTSNNGVYMFVRAESTINAFDAVIMSTYANSASLTPVMRAVPVTTTNAAALGFNMVGFAQTAIASSYYGWVGLNGMLKVNLLVSCQQCHPDATSNFPDSWVGHFIPSREYYPLVYYINLFYKIVIPATIGALILFVLLDAFRRIVNRFQRKGA